MVRSPGRRVAAEGAGDEAVGDRIQSFADRRCGSEPRTTTCADVVVPRGCRLLAGCPPGEQPALCARPPHACPGPTALCRRYFSAGRRAGCRKQHMKLWLDEVAAWRDPDAFEQALLGLRLGDKPQAVITRRRVRPSSSNNSSRTRARSSPAVRLSTTPITSRRRSSSASPPAMPAARSAGRNCSRKSSRKRRARSGPAR